MEQGFSSENTANPASRQPVTERAERQLSASAKPRSCTTCRTRRVRCDKRSPCSNCRRANIACVVPSTDGPPRWARNLEKRPGVGIATPLPVTPNITKVKERLRNLEGLMEQFSREIDEANAAVDTGINVPSTSAGGSEPTVQRPTLIANIDSVPSQRGRFCGFNAHYVTSSFWNKIDEELAGLREATQDFEQLDSESSENETLTQDNSILLRNQVPLEFGNFPFGSNANTTLDEYRPLASQIPYLLEMYESNVNFFVRVIHMPTLLQTTRSPKLMATLALVDEALLFAVYYAAIASMEDSDVLSNFGSSRASLTAKYRFGLETCLARADFLNNPNITVIKALTLFLGLHRRHESPRFVWMMFGVVTRMAQYLGLHRDGAHSPHLSVFDVEMRRRVWWTMCLVDQKTSEDQGTHMVYASLDFDTKPPLNINDSDISPQTTVAPPERHGVTDMSFARISVALAEVHRRLLSSNQNMNIDEKSHLITKIYEEFQSQYLQYTTDTDGGIAYWVSVCMARLVMAKLTLLSFFPVACSTAPTIPSAPTPDDTIQTKLLYAAIHVAEYNHAMNAEESCRHWRWMYQTCTHWHSSVYLALAIPKREWSPIVERAWVALNSPWLIPSKAFNDQRIEIWFPIKKLLRNVQRHREMEIRRLRADPEAARALERQDMEIPFASHTAPFSTSTLVDVFLQRWRRIVGLDHGEKTVHNAVLDDPLVLLTYSGRVDGGNHTAQVGGGPSSDVLRGGAAFGTEDLFANLEPLDDMELDTGENWQSWIESALSVEHADLEEQE